MFHFLNSFLPNVEHCSKIRNLDIIRIQRASQFFGSVILYLPPSKPTPPTQQLSRRPECAYYLSISCLWQMLSVNRFRTIQWGPSNLI